MRRLRGYENRDIGNNGQTPVWMEMPGESTLNFTGAGETKHQVLVNQVMGSKQPTMKNSCKKCLLK